MNHLYTQEKRKGGCKMGKYTNLAKDIIENVGGKDNVVDLKHCVTRLRFNLDDESKANDDVLKNMDGVITIVKAAGQYMVVIGEHVTEVYDEVMTQLGRGEANSASSSKPKKKQSPIDAFLGVIMAGMGPTLNLLCACGIIKGLLVVLGMAGLATDSGIYMLINAAGDCLFYSLPLVLGFNVAKKFEIDPYFGLLFGAALTYPTIQGVDLNMFGYVVNATYTSSFLPVLFGLAFAIPIYKFLNRHIHKLLNGFLTPMITLLVCFPLTFCIIGPFANLVGVGINYAVNFIFELSPIFGGMILAGAWQILVMFGVHGMVTMFAFYDLLAGNPSSLLAMTSGASFAVAGTLLAIAMKNKNETTKGQSYSAMVSAILGVTEPAMYGIIIPRKTMLVTTCVACAISGLANGLMGLKMYTYAGMGVIGLLSFLNPADPKIWQLPLVAIIPFIAGLVLAWLAYKPEKDPVTPNTNESKPVEPKPVDLNVSSPVDGTVKALTDSSDAVFAQETMGKGCLIIPDNGNVYAPVDGTVATLFPTKHAIGLVSNDGVEILIHIGIDTVNLEGKHFEAHIKQGDKVTKGQLLVTFDKEAIEKEGFATEIPVVITNTNNYTDVVEMDHEHHQHGETIIRIL